MNSIEINVEGKDINAAGKEINVDGKGINVDGKEINAAGKEINAVRIDNTGTGLTKQRRCMQLLCRECF